MQSLVRNLLLVAAVAATQTAATSLTAQTTWTGQSHPELLASNGSNGEPTIDAGVAATANNSKTDSKTDSDAHKPVLPPPDSTSEQPVAGEAHASPNTPASADFGVVTRVGHDPSELAVGTVIRTRLDQFISTATTQPGSEFSAEVVRDVLQDNKVIVPTGAVILGRVTKVVENRRIVGSSKLRLRPDEIILPDGSHLMLHAQVIDTDAFTNTRADGEGMITTRDNGKKYWGITGATTTTGLIGGALVGGGVGAAVGAAIGAGIGASHFMMAHPTAELPKRSVIIFELTEAMPILPMKPEMVPETPTGALTVPALHLTTPAIQATEAAPEAAGTTAASN
jgi:hypothetical protein